MNGLLKKSLPHIIALFLFLIVSVIFCKPVLEGNVLNQHDTIGWRGAAENAFQYKEKHGHFPLWNPNVFSGMPNYQIAMHGKSILPDITKILTFGLPKPINFFFLACICFYILCVCLRVNPLVGMITALAYAFSTYNAVVINAGHDTQMMATAYLPLLIAGLISTYNKNYWLGLALTSFAAYQQIASNHLQITYYTFIIAGIITIAYVIGWIRNKEWKHLGIAAGIAIFSAIIGVAGNALILKTTSEYAKYTMRGGKDIAITGDSVTTASTSGLDTSYAFEYSLGKAETFTLLMHHAFGGSSTETLGEDSKVVTALTERNISEQQAIQFAGSLPKYWGDLPYTAGPAYLGVMIFVLGLIGFVLVKSPLRWALLAITLLGVMMSWGKNLLGFNLFLFENLPFYNKFRAPSMAQVIPQFAMGVAAALALQQLLYSSMKRELIKQNFKKILYAVGGLFALLLILWFGMNYSTPIDDGIRDYVLRAAQNDTEFADLVISAMKSERKSMFGGQMFRALFFALVLLGTIYLALREKIKPLIAAIVILVISTLEITLVSNKYLSEDEYVSSDEFVNRNFTPSAIDREILKDTDPNYRVFNRAASTYSETRTSAFHKSIGGYHPAKLRIYQDVIEMYLGARPNPQVLNMLNAKYFIVQDPETGAESLVANPGAFGPAWLVKHVKVVDDRVTAIREIGTTDLRDTAIIDSSFARNLIQPQWDSTASIRMTSFDPDAIEYEVNAASPQFAVFSEIYYPKGWNAYLDGKKVDYVNVNYLLRGLPVPTGNHKIRFLFEPASFKSGVSIMYATSFLIAILLLGGLYMAWRSSRKTES